MTHRSIILDAIACLGFFTVVAAAMFILACGPDGWVR